MNEQNKIENVVVYKERPAGDDRGILIPVLSQADNGEFKSISSNNYPTGILVSRGYHAVNDKYNNGELFLLKTHYYDDEKTEQDGIKRYWTKGDLTEPLSTSTLVPILNISLPPVTTGALPEGFVPPQGIFFILEESEGKLYGPLAAIDSEGNQKLIEPRATPALSFGADVLGVFNVSELTDCICNITINGAFKVFLTSLKDLEGRAHSKLDYIIDSKLLRRLNANKVGKNVRLLAKREAEKLQQALNLFERQNQSFARGNDMLERVKLIIDNYLNGTDIGYQVVKDYFESSKGKVFLTDYVKNNESNLLSGQVGKIEEEVKAREVELNSKIEGLDRQVAKKQQELQEINKTIEEARLEADKEIQQIEQEAEETRRERLKEKEEKLQGDIEKLESEHGSKEQKLKDICTRLALADDIDVMTKERDTLQTVQKYLNNTNSGVQDMIQNPENLAKRMGELEVVSRVLKGGSVSQDNKPAFTPLIFSTTKPSSGADVVDKVRSYLDEDSGKSFSQAEMANLLISITQSFLTVLAGPPGVGKTSSIVRLAQALRLGSSSGHNNFLYMPAARGWVSGRDILGFYNSLNNTYQRARTGLFDFLNRPINNDNNSFQFVLLDEANLSPMEHYWSDFLGMCDKEGRTRPIETGVPGHDQGRLDVQENVRFIATINNDSTTERLSPRLIDRVPVISLEHEYYIDESEFSSGVVLDGALTYDLFEKYFIREDGELSDMHSNKLDKIIGILRDRSPELGQAIAISHRKISAITNYYSAATYDGLMDADTAFDFSVSQYILPHIEGYGTKFKNRISMLQVELGANYPRASRHLERILASGNDFTGTYSFF